MSCDIWHIVVYHSSTSSLLPTYQISFKSNQKNLLWTDRQMDGWLDVHTYVWIDTETGFIRSTHRTQLNNASMLQL